MTTDRSSRHKRSPVPRAPHRPAVRALSAGGERSRLRVGHGADAQRIGAALRRWATWLVLTLAVALGLGPAWASVARTDPGDHSRLAGHPTAHAPTHAGVHAGGSGQNGANNGTESANPPCHTAMAVPTDGPNGHDECAMGCAGQCMVCAACALCAACSGPMLAPSSISGSALPPRRCRPGQADARWASRVCLPELRPPI